MAGITITDTSNAPFIYFNFARAQDDGVIGITLVANRVLEKDQTPVSDYIAVAHLRCSKSAAEVDFARHSLEFWIFQRTPTTRWL